MLEVVDAPSAAIVPGPAVAPEAAWRALATLGYPEGSPLARVVPDGATGDAALVVLLGGPSVSQLGAVRTATPARIVALLTARERAVLASSPGAGALVPFVPAPSHDDAESAEEALRDRIRREVRSQLPAREMLALEPLLEEFDALTVAGAILRMHEARTARIGRPAEPAPVARGGPPPRSSHPRGESNRGHRGRGDRSDRSGPRGVRGGPRP